MHKWVGVLIAILVGTVAQVASVQAAGSAVFVLDPATEQVTVGQTFSVNAIVKPNGESLDTVRLQLSFPPELLEVEEVTLGDVFERQSPGNAVDNDAGTLSQGGFTLVGPKSETGVFCTILFTAKATGAADIQVLSTSRLISAGEEKVNTAGLIGSVVTIGEAVAQGTGELSLTSQTHPNQQAWYVSRIATFDWQPPEGQTISRYLVAFDQDPNTNPTTVTTQLTYTKAEIEDGIWFFHLKGVSSTGIFTETTHYRVQVDATAPNPIVPTIDSEQITVGESTVLRFGTTDELSGIAKYEASLNDEGYVVVESPLTLAGLPEGTHFIEVKAVDRAGNTVYGSTALRVYPEGLLKPKIEEKKSPLLIIIVLGIVALLAIIMKFKKRRLKK